MKSVTSMSQLTNARNDQVVAEESKEVTSRQLVMMDNANSRVATLPKIMSNDITDVPEPDEEEIDKMILNPDEQALKARLWTTLNHKWLKDQRKKK